MDITSLLLSRKYVDDSLAGAGAVKGKSAYEVAVDNGFQGSESDWLASLVGTTPRIGDNGHWFIDDFDTGVIASPSLAGYATEDFVVNEIKKIDLTPFITKEDAQKLVDGAKQDLSSYATKEDVNTAVNNIQIPEVDLSPYATKEDVKEAVGGIQIPETDLSNYPTKDEVAEAIGNIEHPQVDLSEYAKTKDIPSTEGLASEDFVTQKISEAQLADKEVDLTSYYTKTETDQKIKEALENIEVSGDETVVEGSCSCEALTEEEILAIIGAASGDGAVDSQTGQILTEMTAEDVQEIVKNI